MLRNRDGFGAAIPQWFRTLGLRVVMAAMLIPASVVTAGELHPLDAGAQLEAAIHREVVDGDLAGAMNDYRAIVGRTGTPRPVAARAFLRIGLCQEKSGRREEAYDTYRRLVTEYGDQAEVVALARTKLDAWSGPRNLRFEEGVVGKVPPGWFVPSLPKDADYVADLRRGEGCRGRNGCAVVTAPGNVPRPVGNLMQSFSAAAYAGKTVRLRAWLRLERVFMTPAGVIRLPEGDDRAQMWLNVERANHRNGFSDNMDDRPVRSGNWTRCEIVGQIDADARFINFGVMSIGGGRVWVDDVSFEVIPRTEH